MNIGSFTKPNWKRALMIVLFLFVLTLVLVVGVFLSSSDRSALFGGTQTYTHNGSERTYRSVEKLSEKAAGTNVYLVLHGFSGNSFQTAYYTAFHNLVDDNSVVIYPNALKPNQEGLKTGWNAGYCCGSGWVNKVDDVDFLLSLSDSTIERLNLEDAKLSVVGFSNGAFMAQRIASEQPEKIHATVSVAGAYGANDTFLEPTGPTPILLMHGAKDRRVNFDGGTSPNDPDFRWPSFKETSAVWQSANKCDSLTTVSDTSEITYSKGNCSVPFETVIYKNKSHVWPNWRLANVWHSMPEASKRAVEFIDSVE